jgi:Probable cobalt transporter subunit (CbtA)
MLISLGGLVLAVSSALRAAASYGGLNAALIGAAIYIGIIVIAQLILPDINEVPTDFPATVLWKFRMASLCMQAITWGTIGLSFGFLAA